MPNPPIPATGRNVQIEMDLDELMSVYPKGKENIPDPYKYIGYNIDTWTGSDKPFPPKFDPSTKVWTIYLPEGKSITWKAVAETGSGTLKITEMQDSVFQSQSSGTGGNYLTRTIDRYSTADCTFNVSVTDSSGNAIYYSWDPLIQVGTDPG